MRQFFRRCRILACLWFLAHVQLASAQVKRVVVLYDERVDLPGLAGLDASLTHTLTAGSPVPLEIYRETLDRSRFAGASHLRNFRDHLRAKYAAKRIDVVIAVMGASLDFLLENGPSIFPGTPMVFCGIDRSDLGDRAVPSWVTGVLVNRQFRPTLELALQLHPDTRRVVVVSGTSDFDQRVLAKLRRDLAHPGPGLSISYINDLPIETLLEKLANLPDHTLVLYSTLFRDGAGASFVPHAAASLVAAAANAPVYTFVDQYIGRGVVGGHMYSVSAHGEAAASVALRILGGTRPQSVPLIEVGTSTDILDWRQLRRWHIPTSLVPPNADIRFRPATAWQQYRWHIIGALTFAAFQAFIIATLIIERSRRRQHQKRYALASAAGRVGVYDWNLESNELYIDPFVKESLGYQDHEIRNHYDDWSRLMHPDDAPVVAKHVRELIEKRSVALEVEYRVLHRNRSVRWFLARGTAVRKTGRAIRITGTATDITDRKASEEALESTQAELSRVSRLTALGEFAASFVHEVRQPLTAITLNTQACLKWLNGLTAQPNEIKAALQDVLKASKHVNELMQRNCQLFRLDSTRKEPLDLNTVVLEAVLLVRPRLERHQVSLRTSLSVEPIPVLADRVGLEQVLLNLIANSIDATRDLPGPRRIEIASRLSGSEVQLEVSDNGIGLGSVNLQQLFKLAYTTKPNGTGIGLSLSRSIVEAHGGRLRASQNAGPGATFWLTLPLDDATSARSRAEPDTALPHLTPFEPAGSFGA